MASSSLVAIVKSLGHGLLCRREKAARLILQSKLFALLIDLLQTEHRQLAIHEEDLRMGRVTQAQYEDNIHTISLKSTEKHETYQLFGTLFCMIEDPHLINAVNNYIPTLMKLLSL